MKSMRLLAVLAHPDDEFTCAGLIMRWIRSGHEVRLVCATKGEAGRIRNDKAKYDLHHEISVIREEEYIRSCKHLGIHSYYFLNLIDGKTSQWDEVKALSELQEIIDAYNPTHFLSFDEYGGNGHPDHKAISKLLCSIHLQSKDIEFMKISLFPPAFLDRKLMMIPQNMRGRLVSKACRQDLDNYKILNLKRSEYKHKMKMIQIYKSQFPDEKKRYFGQPKILLQAFARYECYEIENDNLSLF